MTYKKTLKINKKITKTLKNRKKYISKRYKKQNMRKKNTSNNITRNKKKYNKIINNKKSKKSKKSNKMKGGYGKGSSPFIGSPWNTTNGNYYSHNKSGIGVGGTTPYYGSSSPMPQHGGSIIPNILTTPYRNIKTGLMNNINKYNGVRNEISPLPYKQNLQ